jgi:hypothetical protein
MKEFCREREFSDGVLVSQQKLLLWLTTKIIPRGSQKGHKTKGVTDEHEQPFSRLTMQGVEKYVCAVISL